MELLNFILNALKSVKDSSIGEGNFGIVVDRFPSREFSEVCAKYHKFGYNPNEYTVLSYAYSKNFSVPKPLGEWPEHRVFAMKRVIGKNLIELSNEGFKFSADVAEEVQEVVYEVCREIRHNDLAPRNIMLEDIVIDHGVIVYAGVYVIDFGESVIKPVPDNDVSEAEGVISWLLTRTSHL